MGRESAIFVDIDNCITPGWGCVGPRYFPALGELAEMIRRANAGNFPSFRFCTGRDINYVQCVSDMLGTPQGMMVVEDGAVFFSPATGEFRVSPQVDEQVSRLFPARICKRLKPVLKEYPVYRYPGLQVSVSLVRNDLQEYIRRVGGGLDGITDRRKLDGMAPVQIAVKKQLLSLRMRKEVRISASPVSVHIMPAAISKGTGLKILAEMEDLDLAHSIGIGDSWLDVPFLSQIGLVGCPENADRGCKEFVRKKRGHASLLPFAEGVVDIINYFTQRQR